MGSRRLLHHALRSWNLGCPSEFHGARAMNALSLFVLDCGQSTCQQRPYSLFCRLSPAEQVSPGSVTCSSRCHGENHRPRTAWLQQSVKFASSTKEPPEEEEERGSLLGPESGDAEAAGSAGRDDGDLDDFGIAAYEAEMRRFAEEAKGDEEFESGAQIQTSLQQERWQQRQQQLQERQLQAEAVHHEDEEEADMPAAYQDDDQSLGMTKTQARFHLQQLLNGKYDSQLPSLGSGSPEERRMEAEMERYMENFKMQVVDINRSNKGTRSGGIGRFSTMVVVGNYMGVLGLGVGRSSELPASVDKAFRQAMKNLFYVPRYRGHTIIHPVKAKYGAVTVYAYPLSSGRGGIRASRLMASICKLAGLENIGVKIHGSRCARNAVKALFTAFESQQTLSQTQKALGNKRIRELAVGMFTRKSSELVPGVKGEWYREVERPGLFRLPLPTPLDRTTVAAMHEPIPERAQQGGRSL